MAVIILVQTQLVAMSAPVTRAIIWQVIGKCVMVSDLVQAYSILHCIVFG